MNFQINKSALLHIPTSQYAFAQAKDVLTIRLRAAKGDLDSCTLFWGDRACISSPVIFSEKRMEVCWQNKIFDFYEETLVGVPERVCYYFLIRKGEEWYYYYGDDFHKELPDFTLEDGFVVEGRSEYYQYPYILRSEILEVPEWFEHAIVYNIFPDSFASGKEKIAGQESAVEGEDGKIYRSKCGGTINGIRENLDYIQNLGFNCLYLNPIFRAGEYHKYDIIDYFHVDPCMGSDEDFLNLTKEVHRRGMHIIIDGVFNHCSWEFPFFEDVIEKGEDSLYKDWFYHLQFPVRRPKEGEIPEYACFAYEPKMPKLNTANPEVQEYFANVGRYWIENFQVDGWRLDVANEVDKNFWRRFRKEIKEANSQAVLIGEVWENAEDWLRGDMLDSVMNYDFRKHCRDFFAMDKIGVGRFAGAMTDMLLRYPLPVARAQLNLLDSHDVGRFFSLCGEKEEKWRLAFLYLFMTPGIPSVFYGDEKKICGMKEWEYRQPMPWQSRMEEAEAFVQEVIRIRNEYINPRDTLQFVEASADSSLLIFERRGIRRIRIILNAQDNRAEIRGYLEGGQVLLEKGVEGDYLDGYGYKILQISSS